MSKRRRRIPAERWPLKVSDDPIAQQTAREINMIRLQRGMRKKYDVTWLVPTRSQLDAQWRAMYGAYLNDDGTSRD